MELTKLKTLSTTKETISKMKRKPKKWKKISAGHISHRGLISKTYKKHTIRQWKKRIQLKMGKGSEQTFFSKKINKQPTDI